ncbi:hypothetical protein ACRALDRAFT_1063414, partial [Sodiomyces alcalophilus JCM 7366]|uniref:uncharacterized protein n=1 Tax=Sodiomyces alcalophilus JCM 7366 TaxID=591952 RepID=UPI0039B62708
MIGNLADYAYRIDLPKAQQRGLGFSACALAMALFNGDLSLLFNIFNSDLQIRAINSAYGRGALNPLPSWLPDNRTTFEQAALLPTQIQRFKSIPARGDKSLVVDGKLAVNGILWDINPCTNEALSSLQEHMQVASGKGDKLRALVRAVLGLERRGMNVDDILEAIIARSMQRQLTSLDEL